MESTDEVISATQAAGLLALTRERLRQLVASGDLPERVAGSSKFRPLYRRREIEVFGRATGRISTVAESPMELIVDELVRRGRVWFDRDDPAHLRIWRRDGWAPVVLIGEPTDGDNLGPGGVSEWVSLARRRWLAQDDLLSIWFYWPGAHRVHEQQRDYLELSEALRLPRHGSHRDEGSWQSRSHDELEAAVGGPISQIPGAVYRIDVIEKVLASNGTPVELVWDRYDLEGLARAAITLADRAPERSGEGEWVMRMASQFIGGAARTVDEQSRHSMPMSTGHVTVVHLDLDAEVWERLDAFAAESTTSAKGMDAEAFAQEMRELRVGLDRLLAVDADSPDQDLRQALERAHSFLPRTGRDE